MTTEHECEWTFVSVKVDELAIYESSVSCCGANRLDLWLIA